MARSHLALCFGEKLDLELLEGEDAPPAAQALVVAQDVDLIMGEVETIEDTAETAAEILARGRGARPRRPGSIVVAPAREGSPLLLQAVVYDFETSPPAREEHVFEALVAVFEEAQARGLSCLAVRPLGTAHAGLPALAFLRLLTQACYSAAELGTSLRRVHLLLPSREDLRRYESLLRQLVGRGES